MDPSSKSSSFTQDNPNLPQLAAKSIPIKAKVRGSKTGMIESGESAALTESKEPASGMRIASYGAGLQNSREGQ